MTDHCVDGAGVHRGTIAFWGTAVPKCVNTKWKMSQGNTGEEIHLVATIQKVFEGIQTGERQRVQGETQRKFRMGNMGKGEGNNYVLRVY